VSASVGCNGVSAIRMNCHLPLWQRVPVDSLHRCPVPVQVLDSLPGLRGRQRLLLLLYLGWLARGLRARRAWRLLDLRLRRLALGRLARGLRARRARWLLDLRLRRLAQGRLTLGLLYRGLRARRLLDLRLLDRGLRARRLLDLRLLDRGLRARRLLDRGLPTSIRRTGRWTEPSTWRV
jgi:hypothetical protein